MSGGDKARVFCACVIAFAVVALFGIAHWYAQQELSLAMEHGYEQTTVTGTDQVIWRKLDPARK